MSTAPKWLEAAKARVAATPRIAVGSDVHLLEMAVADYERLRDAPWEPRPGQPHEVDAAFYKLTVQQRDLAWREVEALKRMLDRALGVQQS
jgi:hypothetical protein